MLRHVSQYFLSLMGSVFVLSCVLLDQEQMVKVVTNLIINSREAIFKNGRIRIETNQNNGWAVLTVADNGCGIKVPSF